MIESKELIIFLSILLSFMAVTLTALSLLRNIKEKNKYNDLLNRVEMDKTRQEYEKKLYEINERLSRDQKRWKDTNHLIFNSQKYNYLQNENNEIVNNYEFIKSSGLEIEDLKIDDDLIFMLTPFNDIEWETFNVVRKACDKLHYKCVRGDEKNISGDILKSIIKTILEASIVIVNINGRNPNVFYELGIAHALGKKTILISKFGEELPFDVQSKNIILYKDLNELSEKITLAIIKSLREK